MDRFFGLDTPATQEGLALARSFFDPISLAMAEEALRDAEIPFLKKERGSGGVVRILAGYQMFGSDIFVREADAERAAELLESLFSGEAADAQEESAEDEA